MFDSLRGGTWLLPRRYLAPSGPVISSLRGRNRPLRGGISPRRSVGRPVPVGGSAFQASPADPRFESTPTAELLQRHRGVCVSAYSGTVGWETRGLTSDRKSFYPIQRNYGTRLSHRSGPASAGGDRLSRSARRSDRFCSSRGTARHTAALRGPRRETSRIDAGYTAAPRGVAPTTADSRLYSGNAGSVVSRGPTVDGVDPPPIRRRFATGRHRSLDNPLRSHRNVRTAYTAATRGVFPSIQRHWGVYYYPFQGLIRRNLEYTAAIRSRRFKPVPAKVFHI